VFIQGKTMAELNENIQDAYELMVTQDRLPALETARRLSLEMEV
jgi:predicted RNase H-like HicB family nuclease